MVKFFSRSKYQEARVNVKNQTGKKLLSVAVMHIHANEYTDSKVWKLVNVGEQTSDSLVARYRTGGFSGRDWWIVTWIDEDGDVYITQPNKIKKAVRSTFNNLAKLALNLLTQVNYRDDRKADLLAVLTKFFLQKGTTPSEKVITAASMLTAEIVKQMREISISNNKQFILRESDAEHENLIIISNDKVTFKFKSGTEPSDIEKLKSGDLFTKDNLRPVYLIAHRCNSAEVIGTAIKKGCNAVECDLQWDNYEQVYVDHLGSRGTRLTDWLEAAKIVANQYEKEFSLIIFDTKFATGDKKTAERLEKVRKEVRSKLPKSLNIVFSIAKYENRETFSHIIRNLEANDGISIDESDEPKEVEAYFDNKNVKNVWYGNGRFILAAKDHFSSINEGTKLRDSNKIIKKVYVWTLAKEDSIKKYFEVAKVDGVMINVPGTQTYIAANQLADITEASGNDFYGLEPGLKVINELSDIRLAERSDKAFNVFKTNAIK